MSVDPSDRVVQCVSVRSETVSLNLAGYMLFACFAFLTVTDESNKMKPSIIFTNVYWDLDIRHFVQCRKSLTVAIFILNVVSRWFQRETTMFIYIHSNNAGIL